jgi:hypothetical protein
MGAEAGGMSAYPTPELTGGYEWSCANPTMLAAAELTGGLPKGVLAVLLWAWPWLALSYRSSIPRREGGPMGMEYPCVGIWGIASLTFASKRGM